MKRSTRPTQHDIARAAGVSTAVVSLVINGRTDGKIKISRATQERVRAAIRELGYVPNLAARQLAGGQTHVIGVFTYESVFPIRPNSFYQPFLIGIEEQAEASGYDLLLFTRTGGDGTRRIYDDGVNRLRAVEGAVLVGTSEDRAEIARLCNEGYPFVFVGRREVEGCDIPYTAADYAGASVELVRQLLDAGHRRILYVGFIPEQVSESAIDRERGYREAMAAAGVADVDGLVHRIDAVTGDHLRDWIGQGITAIATEHMTMARHLLVLASGAGFRVPTDLSIVALGKTDEPLTGHDDIDTFFIPQREMGAQAVELLHRLLTDPAGEYPRQIVIPCQPAAGRTIGPVPERR